MAGIQFERKVSLDTVVTILVLLAAIVGAYWKLDGRMTRLEEHDQVLWTERIGRR